MGHQASGLSTANYKVNTNYVAEKKTLIAEQGIQIFNDDGLTNYYNKMKLKFIEDD